MPGQAQDISVKTGTGEVILGHNHIFTDITAQGIMTHIEVAPGHDTGIITTTLEGAHDAHAPHTEITAIDPTVRHHIYPTADHAHTEFPLPTNQRLK